MSRALVICRSDVDRQRAAKWAMGAPSGTRIEFKQAKRSIPQNDLMWSLLTDVAKQMVWHGKRLTPTDWKLIFMDALDREVSVVPNLDGTGMVSLGKSSSDLSKGEMSDLIEIIRAFGATHGIEFFDSGDQ